MTSTESSAVGMLKLSLRPGHQAGYIRGAAAAIQGLPGVLRVRVDEDFNQIEIIFRHPTVGLLRGVQQALRQAGSEIVAGKTF